MKTRWLAQSGTKTLILVFGGWALGARVFDGLLGDDDVLYVDDFTTLDNDLSETSAYDSVHLLAFSFGVVSAAHWLLGAGLRPSRMVAVNGTLYPADKERGIAPQTVVATTDGLTHESFARFCRRAGLGGAPPQIDIAAAQAELRAIVARGSAPDCHFDRIWISGRDRIIPAAAQRMAWQSQSDAIRDIPAAHQPFEPGQRWGDWCA